MEDFIRFNLNNVLSITFGFIVISIAFIFIYLKNLKAKKIIFRLYLAIVCFFVIVSLLTLKTQLSVNHLPKSEIDRSYQDQTQQNYQNSLKENK